MKKLIIIALLSLSLSSSCFGIYGGMEDFLKETKEMSENAAKMAKKASSKNYYEKTKQKMKHEIFIYLEKMKQGWGKNIFFKQV